MSPRKDLLFASQSKSNPNLPSAKIKSDSEDAEKSACGAKRLLYDDLHVFGQRHFFETPSFVFPCAVRHLNHENTLESLVAKAENTKGKRNVVNLDWSMQQSAAADIRKNIRARKYKERKNITPLVIQCCSVPNFRDKNITAPRKIKSLELQRPKSRSLQETTIVTARAKHVPFDLQCDVCGMKVCKYDELGIHRATHARATHASSKPRRTCSPRTALQVSFYKFHSIPKAPTTAEEDSCDFQCGVCGALFRRQAALAMHQRVHKSNYKTNWYKVHKPFEDPLACKDCGALFLDKEAADLHKVIHPKEKAYKCSLCGIIFAGSVALRNHMAFVHKVLDYLVCQKCGELFNREQELAVHESCHYLKSARSLPQSKVKSVVLARTDLNTTAAIF